MRRPFRQFLCFLSILCHSIQAENVQDMAKAETLRQEGLYADALILYGQIQPTPSNDLVFCQAACYLELDQPHQALSLLQAHALPSPYYFYLTSVAYRHLGHYDQALETLKGVSTDRENPLAGEMALEKGINYFQMKQFKQAADCLEEILNEPAFSGLAHLYLTRIHLAEHHLTAAEQHLAILNQLDMADDLKQEKNYLEGLLFFLKGHYQKAIASLEKTPKKKDTLVYLIRSYLKQADLSSEDREDLLAKAEKASQQLHHFPLTEADYLLLSDISLVRARCLHDADAYSQAQKLLNRSDIFKTEEGRQQALLRLAAAAPTYQERDQLYEQLTKSAEGWYFKGVNDFEEGLFQKAENAFHEAYKLFFPAYPVQAALALKYQCLASFHQEGDLAKSQAWHHLNQLMQTPLLLETFEDPAELWLLAGHIVLNLQQTDETLLSQVEHVLQQAVSLESPWQEQLLNLRGRICMKKASWKEADAFFAQVIQNYPDSSACSEALFWRSECALQLNDTDARQNYLRQLYTQDPQHPYAARAYFNLYTYRGYMQGHRAAIKHLQAMPHLFPSHSLLISAYYLIGLDHLKDHLTQEGKLIRRKDELAAIDAFQLAESLFDELIEQKLLLETEIAYFRQVRYQAMLERALANLAIAEASSPAKKRIYLEYAENVFKQLNSVFKDSSDYPKLFQEGEFWLAQTYTKRGKMDEANAVYDQMIAHFKQADSQQSYLLSRTWYEKGVLAQQKQRYASALEAFIQAEQASLNKNFLSPDQKLDLWIQQSLCYKELKQFNEAMRLLSKVVNDEIISSLRVKAMYLRADLYTLEGRPELALKQLEATAKKGGEWGKKAKERLELDYGYDTQTTSKIDFWQRENSRD